ncbi:hypothetical protein SAMN03097699_2421 [Flavobacteriaceae bacterium MAR_2010_188]|nr:hypothetical protein SAMN03097699_2421 [Flavobacteriaceae bacterium MAR_2010_188]
MISCQQAVEFCHKAQYNEATFLEKLKLKFHLLICKACSKFSTKNATLTSLCNSVKLHALTESEKTEMKEKMNAAAYF